MMEPAWIIKSKSNKKVISNNPKYVWNQIKTSDPELSYSAFGSLHWYILSIVFTEKDTSTQTV